MQSSSGVPSRGRQRFQRRGGRAAGRPIPIADVGPSQVQAWRELAARSAEPNPFFEPECVLPAARWLRERGVALLVVTDPAGEWLGCVPVSRRLRRRRGALPILTTWHHRYSFLGTPLVDAGAVERTTERLLEQMLATGHGIVALPHLGDDGPVGAGLRAALEARGRRPAVRNGFERAVMHRSAASSGDGLTLSARHRRDLRRLRRRLAEALGGPLEVVDRSTDASAVEEFMALEASGWKGDRGTAMDSRRGDAAFFREMCDGFRARGRLQLLVLGTPRQAVSAKCNLVTDEAVFCFKIAFDDAMAHYRPGLQLEVEMVEIFAERMAQRWMDSCADADSEMFARIWRDRRPLVSQVMTDSRAMGSIIGLAAERRHGRPR